MGLAGLVQSKAGYSSIAAANPMTVSDDFMTPGTRADAAGAQQAVGELYSNPLMKVM